MTTLIKKIGAFGAAVAIAGVAVVPLLGAQVGAVSQAQIVEVTVPSSLTLNDEAASPNLNAFTEVTIPGDTSDTLGAGEQKSAGVTLKVFTNNAAGYKLYLTMNSATEAGNTGAANGATAAATTVNGSVNQIATDNKLHLNGGSAVLNALATTGTVGVNEWGAKGGAVTQWTAVPLTGATGFVLKETTAPSAALGDTVSDVSFAANTNSATASGVYSNTVLYTAIAK
jgi:hypothetical protein